MANIVAIIVAAGTGERMKTSPSNAPSMPKQYAQINNHALLYHSAKAFTDHPAITQSICVIHADHRDLYEQSTKSLNLHTPIMGGASRQESVKKALVYINQNMPQTEIVLIHDAARPLVAAQDIDAVIDALSTEKNVKGVSLAYKATDSYRRGLPQDSGACLASEPVDRENLYALQTPQGFDFKTILDAHVTTQRNDHTDDTSLLIEKGLDIHFAAGRMMNIKVTNADDLDIVRQMLRD